MMASIAQLSLVIVATLGTASQAAVALQQTQSDLRSAQSFQDLFQRYLHGDADGAVRAFAAWNDERIEREGHLPPGPDGKALKPALALFHSEAWLRQGSGSRTHYTAAVRLMTKEICPAARASKDDRTLALCRAWYGVLVVAGICSTPPGTFFRATRPSSLRVGPPRSSWQAPQ
jgi:hypothetical protein